MAQTVGQHGVAAFTSPVNGDPLNATVVVANDNTTRGAYVDHDSDPDIHVQSSLLASRPAAGTVGRKWMTTDSGAVKLWFDTGSAWSEIAYLPSAGGTVAGNVSITGTLGVTGVLTATGGVVGAVTGNASTATALQTARAINGVNFDGTAAITVTAAAGTLTGATLASNVLASSLTSVGTLAGLTVTAPITGSVTGSSGSTTGNAATATALQTARTINGTSFDGTANVTVTAAAGTLTGATLASGVTASSLTSVGTLAALTVTAPITGSVTGSSGSTTGNAATATALQTGRAINGVTFDGTAPITVTAAAGTLSGATLASGVTASSLTSVGTLGNLTVTNPITGSVTGSSGSTTGNAATATALQTARAINGTNFDGTAAITVTAAAGTLTGATLASNVLASSLTSVGTLASLAVSGAATVGGTLGVTGDVTIGASKAVITAATGALTITNAASASVTLVATGASYQLYADGSGNLGVYSNTAGANRLLISAAGAVTIPGTLAVTGNLTVDTNTLFVDAVNNRVGVGTATPASAVDVVGAVRTTADGASVSLYTNEGWRHTGSSGLFIDANQGGAANSVTIRNGSGFASQFILSGSGNLGLGVTPSAWISNRRVLQIGGEASAALALNGTGAVSEIYSNAYLDTAGTFRYASTNFASRIAYNNSIAGGFQFDIAPSGTAGNAITFTTAMTLGASGTLAVSGAATIGGTLAVTGAATLGGALTFNTDASFDIGASGANRPRNLFLSGNATLGGTLGVTGAVTLSSSITLGNGQFLRGTRNSGAVIINLLGIESGSDRTLMTATGDFVIQNGSLSPLMTLTTAGAVTIPGTLAVTGATSVSGMFGVTGAIAAGGANRIALANNGSGDSQIWAIGPDNVSRGSFNLVTARQDLTSSLTLLTASAAGAVTIPGTLAVTGAFGMNGKTPVANVTAPTAAGAAYTATEQALLNDIRTRLINLGIYT